MAKEPHQRTSPKKTKKNLGRLFYCYIWCCKRHHQRILENFTTIFGRKTEYYENCGINKTGIGVLKSTDFAYHSCRQDLAIIYLFNMNVTKAKIYKQVLRDICNI